MPRPADPTMGLQLVEAAARLLSEHGRHAVTARRLATEVGASTQVLYTHFDGVDDLLAEVWREGFRRFGIALEEPAVTSDPVADWAAQGWSYRRFVLENPHLYQAMFTDGLRAIRSGRLEDHAAASATFTALLVRIERCATAGRWAVDDLFTAGEVVWASSHGHMMLELHDYFGGIGRDPEVTFVDCLRHLALGYGDEREAVELSLKAARRRARRVEAA
jgi:AcrR family transcriptional regulator